MFDTMIKRVLLSLIAMWIALLAFKTLNKGDDSSGTPAAGAAQLVSCEPYSSILDTVKASVVTITASARGPRGGVPRAPQDEMSFDVPWDPQSSNRTGCGLIVDKSGYILTNLHIVDDTGSVTVRLYRDDKTYNARIAATDPVSNLALLKIDPAYPLSTAELGNSDVVEAGDVVMAIGSPFGLEYSVTRGIISDERRTITVNGVAFPDMIQTDAAVNRGNSGGPLIDSNGLVVGINTAILSPTGVYTGLSFITPINKAKKLLMAAKYSAM